MGESLRYKIEVESAVATGGKKTAFQESGTCLAIHSSKKEVGRIGWGKEGEIELGLFENEILIQILQSVEGTDQILGVCRVPISKLSFGKFEHHHIKEEEQVKGLLKICFHDLAPDVTANLDSKRLLEKKRKAERRKKKKAARAKENPEQTSSPENGEQQKKERKKGGDGRNKPVGNSTEEKRQSFSKMASVSNMKKSSSAIERKRKGLTKNFSVGVLGKINEIKHQQQEQPPPPGPACDANVGAEWKSPSSSTKASSRKRDKKPKTARLKNLQQPNSARSPRRKRKEEDPGGKSSLLSPRSISPLRSRDKKKREEGKNELSPPVVATSPISRVISPIEKRKKKEDEKEEGELMKEIKKQAAGGGNGILDVTGLQVRIFPSEEEIPVSLLKSVYRIDAGFNKIETFPTIDFFSKLQILDLSGNLLQCLGGEQLRPLTSLPHLEELIFAGNRISFISSDITLLQNLKKLDLTNNKLETLPNLAKCTNLEDLNISGNEGVNISSFRKLQSLTALDCRGCKLQRLPPEVCKCTKLLELHLGSNQLETLPEAIGTLTRLCTLNLMGNQLKDLPVSLGALGGLTDLQIAMNPLENKKLVEKSRIGLDHLMEYLELRRDCQGNFNDEYFNLDKKTAPPPKVDTTPQLVLADAPTGREGEITSRKARLVAGGGSSKVGASDSLPTIPPFKQSSHGDSQPRSNQPPFARAPTELSVVNGPTSLLQRASVGSSATLRLPNKGKGSVRLPRGRMNPEIGLTDSPVSSPRRFPQIRTPQQSPAQPGTPLQPQVPVSSSSHLGHPKEVAVMHSKSTSALPTLQDMFTPPGTPGTGSFTSGGPAPTTFSKQPQPSPLSSGSANPTPPMTLGGSSSGVIPRSPPHQNANSVTTPPTPTSSISTPPTPTSSITITPASTAPTPAVSTPKTSPTEQQLQKFNTAIGMTKSLCLEVLGLLEALWIRLDTESDHEKLRAIGGIVGRIRNPVSDLKRTLDPPPSSKPPRISAQNGRTEGIFKLVKVLCTTFHEISICIDAGMELLKKSQFGEMQIVVSIARAIRNIKGELSQAL